MSPDQRNIYSERWESLRKERSTWMSHWSEISTYLLPRSGRFFVDDVNKGLRKHNSILDSTGTRALRVLAAGMMTGMTSPTRPWFRLTTSDPDLAKYQPVKVWLTEVSRLMETIFQKSNTYLALHQMYEELGAFGTASTILTPDFNSVIHHHPLTVGEYCIAVDGRNMVNTLYREFKMSVAQIVGEFGYKNCSNTVRNLYDQGNYDEWIVVVHAVEPRYSRDPSKKDNKNMPFSSCYFERGKQGDSKNYLRESGFRRFPGMCPRWQKTGGDIYGHSPGMEALGDIKQLQHEQLRKANAIDYKSNPPLMVPTNLKNRDVQRLPGGVTFTDMNSATAPIKTLFDVNLDLNHLLADIQDVRERIKGAFYADLFLMLANAQYTRMTATEVAARQEEKLLMLGPVLERLHNELLNPLIDITFDQMVESNLLPPPPEEMKGQNIDIEFVSMLAQAQRAVGINSVDRFVNSLGAVAQFKPEVLDKLDQDRWADEYADLLGVNPDLIVAGDKVALIRKGRQQAQAAQSQMMAQDHLATMAQKMASTDTAGKNALTDMANQQQGVG